MTQIFGVDYARVDGNRHPIDFAAAYKAGVRFAILRGAWGTVEDTIVRRDKDALRAAGILAGAYLFLRCPTKLQGVAEPEAQVRAFVENVGELDLPPSLDVEFPGNGRKDTIFSARQGIAWIERAYEALLKHYPTVMIYTSSRVWREDLADLPCQRAGQSPLWEKVPYYWKTGRHYDLVHSAAAALPPPWKAEASPGAWIRQIQGDARDVPGFSATTDINLFLECAPGEKSERVKWCQKKLNDGWKKLRVDGDFGPKTEGAVCDYQVEHRLATTGIVDLDTFACFCR